MSEQIIRLTDTAANRIKEIMSNADNGTIGVRVGVKSGGCAGMSYTMEYVSPETIGPSDEIYEYETKNGINFRVISDPKSLLYIYGMQLDFSNELIGGGFNFTNPNATQTCGCGSSFAV